MTSPESRAETVTYAVLTALSRSQIMTSELEASVAIIAQAIREAEDAAYDRAYREITLTALMNDDHEPASAEFVNGLVFAADRVRNLKSQET